MIKPTAAQLKEFEFSKIKIDAEGKVSLSYERKTENGTTTIGDETPDGIAHETFVAAFQELNVHAAIYAEYLDMKKYKTLETAVSTSPEPGKIRIGTVNFGEMKNRGEWIMISFTRDQQMSSPFNATLPRLFLTAADEEKGYPYLEELNKSLKEVKRKAVAYVFGEYAVDPQIDLFKDKGAEE